MPEPEFRRLCSYFAEDSQQELLLVGVYAGPIPGEYELDRIQLVCTPAGKPPRGWIMTASEARTIITGLQMAVEIAEKEGWADGQGIVD